MTVKEALQSGLFILDGGTGSRLQSLGLKPGELPETWNIKHPEHIIALGREYFEAGSNAICTNTFGANELKYDGVDGQYTVEEIINAAVDCAKEARRTASGQEDNRYIMLDIGPLGKLLEPLGTLSFEDAVRYFARQVKAGVAAGVDVIYIETMNDSYETKAAVLAAKENSTLPVIVSNVYDEGGKLMSGAEPEAMAAMLEGLHVDAIGMNCSLGPVQMKKLVKRFYNCLSVPLLVKPNAGLPRSENGQTVYDVDAQEYSALMKEMVQDGARLLGGCCGTTPEYIKALTEQVKGVTPLPVVERKRSVISSYTHAVTFGERPIRIGERINPTGKKRFKEALRNHEISYVLKEGVREQEAGAEVLDVNVGLPEIDEPSLLLTCVKELQSVSDLPLQIDTSDAEAMAGAMRFYNGKPMINSVNGNDSVMDAVFPLVAKYGGFVVCLTLDEQGIPETAEGRFAIAKRIAEKAKTYGIPIWDLIFDPLAMTISTDTKAALVTLDAISLIKSELHACCSLGISNISFGLPNRDLITSTFFLMAMQRGLDAAIMNPFSMEVNKAYHTYLALAGLDDNCTEYIAYAVDLPVAATTAGTAAGTTAGATAGTGAAGAAGAGSTTGAGAGAGTTAGAAMSALGNAICHGLSEEAGLQAEAMLANLEPLELINQEIVPALDVVGQAFDRKTLFLPQLLMSAEAAKAAFEAARKAMPANGETGPKVILATVKGDIHDIGKNIVKALMENYGFTVLDLGRDVDARVIADTAIAEDVKLVGLSALMTTTVPAMADTIALLRAEKPDCKVIVGGAVLTQEYADQIGADAYGPSAMDTVRYANLVLKGKE